MDESLILVAALPFYALAVYAVWWGMNFGQHMLRRVDESTKKTELTETIQDKGSDTK